MSLYNAIHFLFGEYIFETDTNTFPRFANLLSKGRLSFWGSEYINGRVRFHTSVFTAEQIAASAREVHAPLEIVGRRGLPFVFSRYRRRYGLFFGLALGLFLIFYSQLFVWKINISGNIELSASEIEKALEACGVSVGTFIPEMDVGYKENQLLLDYDAISSVAISIQGTHLSVTVLERTPIPDIIDTGGYYNVIAERDGIILDIDAADGTPAVHEGDTVFAGELLINSFIEGKNGTFRPTHARGIVYAAVNEHYETTVPLERVSKKYTGATQTKTHYKILGWNVPSLFGEETDYEYFDAISAEHTVKLFGFIEMPIKLYRVTYTEYTPYTETITAETAELLALSALDDHLNHLDLEVLECETEFNADEKNGICILTANAVLKQNIAKEVEFNLNQSISDKLPNARE